MKPLHSLSDTELGDFIRRARKGLPDAPLSVQQTLIGLWHASPFATAKKTLADRVLNRIAAVLSFDSWAEPALNHGMRAGPAAARHLMYSAAGRDVDLRISAKAQAFCVAGQVLGVDDSGIVELAAQYLAASGSHAAHITALNALGEFRIDGLREGSYRLTLRMGEDEIVLPAFDVGEPTH